VNAIYDYSASATAISKVSERYRRVSKNAQYIRDPVAWVRDKLGMHLWSLQRDITNSVLNSKKTIVKSCHDSGKTFLAAILVCWWIDTHPPDETMVISTAPTAYQVNKLLWEYIRRLHRVHKLSGTVSEASEWKSDDRAVVGMGRKPADTNIHGFQGIHRKYVLVVIDEACGVPQQIWTGVEAITTNPDNRILAIGNPDDRATEFGRIFTEHDPSWNPFTISAYDTPNFTEEWRELPEGMAELLLEKAWVEDKVHSWGEDSARFKAKVLAEFPAESVDTFFSPLNLQLGLTNTAELEKEARQDTRPVFGVDVARFGNDYTTVIKNDNGILSIVDSWDKSDTVESAMRIHNLAVQHGVTEVRVDASGLGVGVVDQLTRVCSPFYVVIEMVGSAASPDINRWYNQRAYLHDVLREGFQKGWFGLPALGNKGTTERTLYEELEGLRYKFLRGAILIESKDDMRKRNVKSPDYSDAATYAIAPIDITDPDLGKLPNQVGLYDAIDEDEMMAQFGWTVSPV
jgi:hypothetical protein